MLATHSDNDPLSQSEYVEQMLELRRKSLQAAMKAHDRQQTLSAIGWALRWLFSIGFLLWGAQSHDTVMFIGGIVMLIINLMMDTSSD